MNLQYYFLIVMFVFQDFIFCCFVVYICEYNDEGVMGIIINKLLENLQVEGIFEKFKIVLELCNLEICLDKLVMLGGLLVEDCGFILYILFFDFFLSICILDNMVIIILWDVFEILGIDWQLGNVLVVLGYFLWEKGQLEQEILDNVWFIVLVDQNIFFCMLIVDCWCEVVKLIGIDIVMMSGVVGYV